MPEQIWRTAGFLVLGLTTSARVVSSAEIAIIVPNAFENQEGDWAVEEVMPDYRLQMIVGADRLECTL